MDFARELEIDKSLVSNYERGVHAVDDERATQIAEVLGMDEIDVRRGLGLWVPSGDQAADEDEEDPHQMLRDAQRLINRADEILRRDREAS